MEDKRLFTFADQFKTFWPVVLVVVSLAAQWAILGQRVNSLEDQVDRNGLAIIELRGQVQQNQQDYAALNQKVDGIKESVDYIRNRIDRALTN